MSDITSIRDMAAGAFSGIKKIINTIESGANTSLANYSKKAMVNSRVYIDESLQGESILDPLMKNIMNLYVSLITTAMSMNQYITGTKKVRDIMSIVSTEDYKIAEENKPVFTETLLGNYFGAMESSPLFRSNNDYFDIYGSGSTSNKDIDLSHGIGGNAIRSNKEKTDEVEVNAATSPVKPDIETPISTGRVLKFDFKIHGESISINLFVQLNPRFIPSDVARQFVALNFTPSFKQRWMQMSAGEIRFIRDLIFCADLHKQARQAMIHDTSGALAEMLSKSNEGLFNAIAKMSTLSDNAVNKENIANTILVFEKNNFMKACSNAGFRFDTYANRQRFFEKTFSLMVVVVDVNYNKVDLYYNGLSTYSTFNFDQLKKNAKTESLDITKMMESFARGMGPRI